MLTFFKHLKLHKQPKKGGHMSQKDSGKEKSGKEPKKKGFENGVEKMRNSQGGVIPFFIGSEHFKCYQG